MSDIPARSEAAWCCSRFSTLSQNLHFVQGVENLAVEEFFAHLGVEAIAVAVFPRRAGFDIEHGSAGTGQPFAKFLGHELRAVAQRERR